MKEVNLTPAFVLVHGAWHRPAHWMLLRRELERNGFFVTCPDLPSDDPEATFNDDTQAVVDSSKHLENIFLVTHSRGVEVLPRIFNVLERDQFIGATILSSAGPYTNVVQPGYDLRHLEPYQQGVIDRGDGLTEFDKEIARDIFYNEVSDADVIEFALTNLRPQRKAKVPADTTPPPLPDDLPIAWRMGSRDLVHDRSWVNLIAQGWAGVQPEYLGHADHVPQLSRPEYLAKLLISDALNATQA